MDNPLHSSPLSTSASLTLHLRDINDNPPTFDKDLYNFKVNEVTPINSPIGTVQATDSDNHSLNSIQYFIVHSSSSDFDIDRLTGEIFTSNILDRERTETYLFEVMATDSGSPHPLQGYAAVNITIEDSNDNAPRFESEKMSFHIEENQPEGVELGQVKVIDQDLGQGGHVELMLLMEQNGELEKISCVKLDFHSLTLSVL